MFAISLLEDCRATQSDEVPRGAAEARLEEADGGLALFCLALAVLRHGAEEGGGLRRAARALARHVLAELGQRERAGAVAVHALEERAQPPRLVHPAAQNSSLCARFPRCYTNFSNPRYVWHAVSCAQLRRVRWVALQRGSKSWRRRAPRRSAQHRRLRRRRVLAVAALALAAPLAAVLVRVPPRRRHVARPDDVPRRLLHALPPRVRYGEHARAQRVARAAARERGSRGDEVALNSGLIVTFDQLERLHAAARLPFPPRTARVRGERVAARAPGVRPRG